MTIFEHLKNITVNKKSWKKLSESDRKTWNTFMINRWLSSDDDLIDIIDDLQQYTIGMDDEKVYKLYLNILPKRFTRFTYNYGKQKINHNKDLLNLISDHFNLSIDESKDYLDLIDIGELTQLLEDYGFDKKEIKGFLK